MRYCKFAFVGCIMTWSCLDIFPYSFVFLLGGSNRGIIQATLKKVWSVHIGTYGEEELDALRILRNKPAAEKSAAVRILVAHQQI